jgi:GT2 family glycosyltransferase
MSLPRVQIVILNWNGFQDTIGCLASVFALDYPDFRVVVCDNGSSDGSLGRIREWADRGESVTTGEVDCGLPSIPVSRDPIRYIEYDRVSAERGGNAGNDAPLVLIRTGGNLGFTGGNNVGLRYVLARGHAGYVWLLNNDTIVDPGALRELVAVATSDSRLAAVGGTLLEYDQPDVIQDIGGANFSHWHGMITRIGHGRSARAPRPVPERLDYISGGCMLVRTSVLPTIGLLDERFFIYGEDTDWCLRMRAAGFALAYAPGANIWHKSGGSSALGGPFQTFHNTRCPLLLIHKYQPARLPVAFAYSLYRCLLPKIVRRQGTAFRAVLRAYIDVARFIAAHSGAVIPRSTATAAFESSGVVVPEVASDR